LTADCPGVMIHVPKVFADSLAAAGSQTVSKKNMQAAAGSAESYTLKNVLPKNEDR